MSWQSSGCKLEVVKFFAYLRLKYTCVEYAEACGDIVVLHANTAGDSLLNIYVDLVLIRDPRVDIRQRHPERAHVVFQHHRHERRVPSAIQEVARAVENGEVVQNVGVLPHLAWT